MSIPDVISRTFASAVFVALSALMLAGPASVQAQDLPEYDVDVVAVRAAGNDPLPSVDLYTRIPYSKLRFLSSPDGFTARYEVSVEIVEVDADGKRMNVVESPIWERTVRVVNYGDTQVENRFDFSTHSVKLRPGQYLFEFQIDDKSSNESFVTEQFHTVRDLSDSPAMSDILVVDRFDDDTKNVYPSVAKRISSVSDELTLFYELYLDRAQTIKFRREVVRVGGLLARSEGNAASEVVSSTDESAAVEAGRSQHVARVKLDDLPVGSYDVIISALDEAGVLLASSQTSFDIDWSGLEEHLSNLDDAIAQLQYIAKTRDIRFIRDGESDTEKWRRFEDFWRKRDPTPGTIRNEKMEEYYYRVAFANRRYSSATEGWRTDRGQVMVLYGQPDIIENHPFNFSVKPYEVWYYYRIGRRFIFVDQSGLGDYTLLVPIWDETTRIR
ncbi:MAG: GWxTD domain-containing protein [Bacteroidetes bacterium]|nr:GWxTD domain-containing protein [Bacteroidota bacterium]